MRLSLRKESVVEDIAETRGRVFVESMIFQVIWEIAVTSDRESVRVTINDLIDGFSRFA